MMSEIVVVGIFGFDRKSHNVVNLKLIVLKMDPDLDPIDLPPNNKYYIDCSFQIRKEKPLPHHIAPYRTAHT